MDKTEFGKAPLVFGSSNVEAPAFHRDLEFFVKAEHDLLNRALKLYLSSKYRRQYRSQIDKLSKEVDLPSADTARLFNVLDFFAYWIVRHHEINDILSAVNELVENLDSDSFTSFLRKLKEKTTQDAIEVLNLVDNEYGTINPRFKNLTFNIQERIVVQNGEIIRKIPVLLLRIDVSGSSEKDAIIELVDDDIERLIDALGDIRKTFNLLNKRGGGK